MEPKIPLSNLKNTLIDIWLSEHFEHLPFNFCRERTQFQKLFHIWNICKTVYIAKKTIKMDDLMDFFDFSKDFKRGTTARGCISGDPRTLASEPHDSKPIKREIIGKDYVNEIVEKEKKLMNRVSKKRRCAMHGCTICMCVCVCV